MKYIVFTLSLPLVAAQANATELTINLQNVDGEPLENVVIYATPATGTEGLPANTQQLTINQEGKKFAPYVTVMQKGQTIEFNNKDDITHHIYSVSGNNRFEFKLKANSTKSTQVINSTEEIAMGCNIHDWMSGYTLVVDTPYYGKTNDDGVLTLPVQSVGDYKITVWHPQLDQPNNRIEKNYSLTTEQSVVKIKLPNALLPLPEQLGEDDFDFLEDY